MDTVKVSEDGKIEIPESIRKSFNLEPGREVEFVETDHGVVLRPVSPFPPTTLDEVIGSADYKGPRIPIEEMSGSYVYRLRMQQEGEGDEKKNESS